MELPSGYACPRKRRCFTIRTYRAQEKYTSKSDHHIYQQSSAVEEEEHVFPETGNQVAYEGFDHNSDWQFGSIAGHMCGQQITISLNGKTAQATIVDECPGCAQNGLDCTPATANFFGFFDDLAWGSWSVGGNPVSMPPPPTAFKALFTTSTPPPPTTSSIVPTVSSSSSSSVWSSLSSLSSSAASSSFITSSIATSSTAVGASSAAAPTPTSNIATLYANVVNMALLVLADENAQ
ncbi:uncharacterized protein PHACADRAFT_255107 [Phanerochaete carnosa HHB-10118-sp]|uniref:RlpA-like protein double-psi beta-barrel domain-containing protein n=1 Tax=Phanerochaete carnosa (strain HHB-10118-sp) TaxID=650164 RepID=K5X3L1_PHACS|nr:uncharacterized protein PHACADRAFT_255107 [Phanerochaete carnosa HHB-10118-sp]EKM57382.1 hypothetical protein PHACADRAFT_255107 [Phanerochaete carnosa HHB-10118-sp]